jgi:hypothetical protein
VGRFLFTAWFGASAGTPREHAYCGRVLCPFDDDQAIRQIGPKWMLVKALFTLAAGQ